MVRAPAAANWHGGAGADAVDEPHPLKAVSNEAVSHAEILLSRVTLTAVVLILAGAAAYHFAGRDVQADVFAWFANAGREGTCWLPACGSAASSAWPCC